MKLGLWATVSFHRELHLMVWQPRGVLGEAHVDELILMLDETERKADHPFNRYADLSKLDSVEVSFDYVFRVALHRRTTYGERPNVKSVFYVRNRETAAVAMTHMIVMGDSPIEVRIFNTKTAAAKWLDVPIEALQLSR